MPRSASQVMKTTYDPATEKYGPLARLVHGAVEALLVLLARPR
jgi:hypothetical protein